MYTGFSLSAPGDMFAISNPKAQSVEDIKLENRPEWVQAGEWTAYEVIGTGFTEAKGNDEIDISPKAVAERIKLSLRPGSNDIFDLEIAEAALHGYEDVD